VHCIYLLVVIVYHILLIPVLHCILLSFSFSISFGWLLAYWETVKRLVGLWLRRECVSPFTDGENQR
jgi:hypothetical protein